MEVTFGYVTKPHTHHWYVIYSRLLMYSPYGFVSQSDTPSKWQLQWWYIIQGVPPNCTEKSIVGGAQIQHDRAPIPYLLKVCKTSSTKHQLPQLDCQVHSEYSPKLFLNPCADFPQHSQVLAAAKPAELTCGAAAWVNCVMTRNPVEWK